MFFGSCFASADFSVSIDSYNDARLCLCPLRALTALGFASLSMLLLLPYPVQAQVAPGYKFTPLVKFTGESGNRLGSRPVGGVTVDNLGNLYGTTSEGGVNPNGPGNGTLYRYNPSTNSFTTLVNFTRYGGNAPGLWPQGTLTLDSIGNLYGTTSAAGNTGGSEGTVFQYNLPTSTFSTLVNFGVDGPGRIPLAPLTLDRAGNLYGTTQNGSATDQGTLFRYSLSTSTFTSLISFGSVAATGTEPAGVMALDKDGNLYGTTPYGGKFSRGTLFRYTPATDTFTTLIDFGDNDVPGVFPNGGVTIDDAGNLYGTTQNGGIIGNGILYRYTPSTGTFTTLVNFTGTSGNALGASPRTSVIIDKAGNLYGTTQQGGSDNFGTVYRYDLLTDTFTTLISFTGTDGNAPGLNPYAGVTLDGMGNIFGTTLFGGIDGNGILFEVTPLQRAAPEPGTLILLTPLVFGFFGVRQRRNNTRRVCLPFLPVCLIVFAASSAPNAAAQTARKPPKATPPAAKSAPAKRSKVALDAALCRAVKSLDEDRAWESLNAGADPNARDNAGVPVLLLAIRATSGKLIDQAFPRGDAGMVQLLLARKANVNLADRNGVTPLMASLLLYTGDVAKMLVEAGANVNQTTKRGTTALMIAAEGNDTLAVEMLLAAGAAIDVRDDDGHTPLMYALRPAREDESPAGRLAGASMKLGMALLGGSLRGMTAAELLVEKGADIKRAAKDGTTPLHLAAVGESPKLVMKMLKQGADPNAKALQLGVTPLISAIIAGRADNARVLLANGANPTLTDNDQRTPLHYAAWKGRYAIAEMLLLAGVDRNAKDKDGDTPKSYAETGKMPALKNLLASTDKPQ